MSDHTVHERVVKTLRVVPVGTVVSYGQLADSSCRNSVVVNRYPVKNKTTGVTHRFSNATHDECVGTACPSLVVKHMSTIG